MRKSIKKVFWLYVVMFACLIFSIMFILFNSTQKTNSHNPRIKKDDPMIISGDIRDYNGNVLVETIKENDIYKRNYVYNKEFAHIIGYSAIGKTGIESKYHFELNKVKFEIFERIKQILYKTDLKGNNIILTLDKDIQHKAYELLGNKKGSIIAMEPSTGKILAMVSYPNFNPNTIENDWDKLNTDVENSPLLNRATQGLYAPGSVFKIVTVAATIENMPDWQNFSYECLGEANFGDKRIRCYNTKNHGIINLQEAFMLSCNTTFATLGEILGSDVLKKTSERLDFNKSIKYPLDYNQSTFSLVNGASQTELVQTSIGQGKTLTTPLQMARIVSAVANGGILMQPYIVDHIEDNNGVILKKYMPKKEKQFFSHESNDELVKMMVSVVDNGTATSAKIKDITVAGKTGTAEVDGKLPHSWFVGFAPAENPKISVVVLLENSGEGATNATPIAKELIKTVLNKQK